MENLTPEQIRRLRYQRKADRPVKFKRRYSERMKLAEQRYQEQLARELRKYI